MTTFGPLLIATLGTSNSEGEKLAYKEEHYDKILYKIKSISLCT